MDKELACDFYIGNRVGTPIKAMKYEDLAGFRKLLKFVPLLGAFYWLKGGLNLPFKSYKIYFIPGEPYCLYTWYLLTIASLLRKRTFLWSHGWYGDEGKIKTLIKKLFFGLSDKVLLYGNHARNLMIKEGIDQNKLECVYNSMDYDNQVMIRAGLDQTTVYQDHFSNSDPVLLFIGRIHKAKKPEQLIEAFASLNEKDKKCNLVLIGDELEDTGIKGLIDSYMLNGRVWYVGPIYDEAKLGEFIYNADVCVSPGNVGLTAIHCLTYGTPVITHENFTNQGPEFEAIRQDVSGSFFKENSVEDLCRKIEPWISRSKERRAAIREECYKTIDEKYNPHYQIAVLKKLVSL